MTYLLIYLIGCVVAYPLFKIDFTSRGITWTVGLRRMAFAMSLFSWITVCVGVVFWVAKNININSDRPAKW